LKLDNDHLMEKDNSRQIELSNVVQMKEKLAENGGRPVRKTVLNFVPTCADALDKIVTNVDSLQN